MCIQHDKMNVDNNGSDSSEESDNDEESDDETFKTHQKKVSIFIDLYLINLFLNFVTRAERDKGY